MDLRDRYIRQLVNITLMHPEPQPPGTQRHMNSKSKFTEVLKKGHTVRDIKSRLLYNTKRYSDLLSLLPINKRLIIVHV